MYSMNIMYYRYIITISCVDLESFLIVIDFDVASFSNVFSSLIYVFKYKRITVLNQ